MFNSLFAANAKKSQFRSRIIFDTMSFSSFFSKKISYFSTSSTDELGGLYQLEIRKVFLADSRS